MKNITERHEFILNKLKKEGKVAILDLAEEINISSVTIRKDLKMLEEKNLLFRTKGGGSLTNPYAIDKPVNEKELINSDEKRKIARAAISLIGQTDSIMIGSGSTVFELARMLYPDHKMTAITPALKVGLELNNRPNIEVLQLGGLIRPNSSSVAGTQALQVLDEISCDLLFLGVDGIDLEHGVSISNIAEASLNRKMIEVSQKLILLADSSKFNKRGLGKICNLDQVEYIVTDRKISEKIVFALQEKGIKVVLA
ncbi:DeoR/GlpR family DNA-binding transcription regulator [Niabella aurantiaca]|uniref:DeoR/GlpR family DNA-binding transcription regulator n=1 Tax=Niabella aurantiaca TaxID=379900 RepID=UPI0003749959|nr:DeoR/GlpR family DNA-binding transcription regulator [Niabella aurantiaca]